MVSRDILVIGGVIALVFVLVASFFVAGLWLFSSMLPDQGTPAIITSDQCVMRCSITFEETGSWPDFASDGKYHLYYINFSTDKKTTVTSKPVDLLASGHYGGKVVWVDKSSGVWKMYLKDLSTLEETELLTTRADQLVFFGDKIVFMTTHMIDGTKIYVYDLNTKQKTPLMPIPEERSCLDMHGDNIIYREYINGSTLYLHDVVTNTREAVDMKLGDGCASIYENKIVYAKDGYIYLYNIDTNRTELLTKIENPIVSGEIFSNRLNYINVKNDKVKYLRRTYAGSSPSFSQEHTSCIELDINTKQKTDVTCEGGILSWV